MAKLETEESIALYLYMQYFALQVNARKLQMTRSLDTVEAKTWIAFLRAHAFLMREMERVLMDTHGISLTWMDVLVQLSLAEKKRMTHTRLGERVLISLSGLTRVIDRMATAGLVTRRASRTDRRASYVVLTERGERTLAELMPTHMRSVEERFVRHLHAEEMAIIRSFFRRLLNEE